MRAFLSHSSKDKYFVRQVADLLGEGQCEYDEKSFEYILNVRAIRNALERCNLFVFFLSNQSINSSFVTEEQRTALEFRGAGLVNRVIIFTLDETSYKALPDWLREINVVQRLSSPKLCARKIQAALIRLEAEEDAEAEIYLGRETEDALIARVLSGSPAKTPVALHAVGHYGVGRKTFLRQNLHKLFPKRFETFSEITVSSNQGIEELYRQLHDLMETTSLAITIKDVDTFSTKGANEQYELIALMIANLLAQGEFLLIIDDGGVYTEEGDYQPHLKKVLERIDGKGLPALGFIQSRMMPVRFKEINKRSYHHYIPALQDESTRNIFGLILKQLGVDYTDEQVATATEFLDGHPFNIRFAAAFSHDYGLDALRTRFIMPDGGLFVG